MAARTFLYSRSAFVLSVLSIFVALIAAMLLIIYFVLYPQSLTPKGIANGGRVLLSQRAFNEPPPEKLVVAEPTALMPLSPDQAEKWNAAVPVADVAITRAAPFRVDFAQAQDWGRARDCLAAAVYYEAGSEAATGQRAVAQVVLNRTRHPAYPGTVCGVVFEGSQRKTGCQFTFACDGALMRRPNPSGWARAQSVANASLAGYVEPSVGLATHYHTKWVVPYWSSELVKLNVIGAHIFLKWRGGWGLPRSFARAYKGGEPKIPWIGGSAVNGFDLAQVDPLTSAVPLAPGRDFSGVMGRPTLRASSPADSDGAAPGNAIGLNERPVLTTGGGAQAVPQRK